MDLLSSSVDGEIKLWDLRNERAPTRSWQMFGPHGLSAFDVHEQTGVFAAYVEPLIIIYFCCPFELTRIDIGHRL